MPLKAYLVSGVGGDRRSPRRGRFALRSSPETTATAEVSCPTSSTGRENHLSMLRFIRPLANQNITITGRKESSRLDDHQAGPELRSQNAHAALGEELDQVAREDKRQGNEEQKDDDRKRDEERKLLIAVRVKKRSDRKRSARR